MKNPGRIDKGEVLRLIDVKRALVANKTELKAQGVKSLAVFGSVSRGEAGPKSDVDLLVEFDRSVGLFHFIHLRDLLKELLGGTEVDLVVREAIYEELKDDISEELVDVI